MTAGLLKNSYDQPSSMIPGQATLDRVIHVATWITAAVMAVVVILPLNRSNYFIWTYLRQQGRFISGPGELLQLMVMAFPIIAAPLLIAATYARHRGLRCGLIGVTVLLQYGYLVYYLMVWPDRNLNFSDSSVFLLAHLGCFYCLQVGVAGLAGRLSGTTAPVWRWTSAGGAPGSAVARF